jgi:hypothetical protein
MFLWVFSGRIHPSGIPARLIRRLIDDIPSLAVIKAEAARRASWARSNATGFSARRW